MCVTHGKICFASTSRLYRNHIEISQFFSVLSYRMHTWNSKYHTISALWERIQVVFARIRYALGHFHWIWQGQWIFCGIFRIVRKTVHSVTYWPGHILQHHSKWSFSDSILVHINPEPTEQVISPSYHSIQYRKKRKPRKGNQHRFVSTLYHYSARPVDIPYLLARWLADTAKGRLPSSSVCGGQYATRLIRGLELDMEECVRGCLEIMSGMKYLEVKGLRGLKLLRKVGNHTYYWADHEQEQGQQPQQQQQAPQEP